jgi:EAL and modified HD-GYP domain-containing signal transduction protein
MASPAYIARQPIVDDKSNIVGYQLLYRRGMDGTVKVTDYLEATLQVMANALSDLGTRWVLGDKIAFVTMDEQALLSGFTELFPSEQTVVDLIEDVQVSAEVLEVIEDLRAKGYRFSMHALPLDEARRALLAHADFIKVDTARIAPDKLSAVAGKLGAGRAKLIAEKVETQEQFRAASAAGIRMFQGYYFAKPETLTAKVIQPAHASVLSLINLAARGAEAKDIETAFKRDVALSYKLLRYINSVGFGLSCEIQSIRHAVAVLGMKQLHRWLTLLLVTASADSTPPALVRTAVTRGRLVELLGAGIVDKQDADSLFVVGIFSLLDVMLGMPMEDVLEKMVLSESVSDALLHRSGMLGPFLQLAEACEIPDEQRIRELSESLGIDPAHVNQAHIAALAWVEALGI